MSDTDIEASKAPLMEHLIELRSRLIKSIIAFIVAFIGCFYFSKEVFDILALPLVWIAGPDVKLIYTGLLEKFFTQLKLSMFGAAFIAFPIIAAQIYKFVAPGLYKHEKRAFLPYLVATPIFFGLGTLLAIAQGVASRRLGRSPLGLLVSGAKRLLSTLSPIKIG
mgnify:CR=1 FL=1